MSISGGPPKDTKEKYTDDKKSHTRPATGSVAAGGMFSKHTQPPLTGYKKIEHDLSEEEQNYLRMILDFQARVVKLEALPEAATSKGRTYNPREEAKAEIFALNASIDKLTAEANKIEAMLEQINKKKEMLYQEKWFELYREFKLESIQHEIDSYIFGKKGLKAKIVDAIKDVIDLNIDYVFEYPEDVRDEYNFGAHSNNIKMLINKLIAIQYFESEYKDVLNIPQGSPQERFDRIRFALREVSDPLKEKRNKLNLASSKGADTVDNIETILKKAEKVFSKHADALDNTLAKKVTEVAEKVAASHYGDAVNTRKKL